MLPGDSLGSGSNSPDKAQQLSSYCCDNLPLVLAGRAQLHISLMQPVLRLPCNLLGLFRDALLSSAQTVPDTWRTSIAPCGFDNDASQVSVAGLRDASTPGSLTTGILAWYNAAVTHQLPSTVEAGYLAQLGRDGYSRDICDTAQCLLIVDDLLQRRRCQLHRFHDGLLQALDPPPHVLDLVQIILARGLLSDLGETQLRDPDQIRSCP